MAGILFFLMFCLLINFALAEVMPKMDIPSSAKLLEGEDTSAPTFTPTAAPTETPSAAPSLRPTAPTPVPTTPQQHQENKDGDVDEFDTSNLYYIYSGVVVVIMVAVCWFGWRSLSDYCQFGGYSLLSTSDTVELFPRPPGHNGPSARDVELARFDRMAGGTGEQYLQRNQSDRR